MIFKRYGVILYNLFLYPLKQQTREDVYCLNNCRKSGSLCPTEIIVYFLHLYLDLYYFVRNISHCRFMKLKMIPGLCAFCKVEMHLS
jgi:hypothetical protein